MRAPTIGRTAVWVALLATVSLSSCLTAKINRVRETTTSILGCPEKRISVRETNGGWIAQGCGKGVRCTRTSGPCTPMGCEDVARNDLRECQEAGSKKAEQSDDDDRRSKAGDGDGDCTSIYTSAIRECAISDAKELSRAFAPAAPIVTGPTGSNQFAFVLLDGSTMVGALVADATDVYVIRVPSGKVETLSKADVKQVVQVALPVPAQAPTPPSAGENDRVQPPQSSGSQKPKCSIDQVLKMKEMKFTDEQIKGACE